MGAIVIQILILLIIWLMSCAVCTAVGFFIGSKGLLTFKKKNVVEREIDPYKASQAEREQRELHNMLTYDGTPQDAIDADLR